MLIQLPINFTLTLCQMFDLKFSDELRMLFFINLCSLFLIVVSEF